MSKKGSTFEREIPIELSEWWSYGERKDVFWRKDSGARAKRRFRKNGELTFGAHGDIVAADPIGLPLTNLITLELKRGYRQWSFFDILDAPPMRQGQKNRTLQSFEKFMLQVQEDSEAARTWPTIISKRDKRTKIISLPKPLILDIEQYYGKFKGTKIIIEYQNFDYTMTAIVFSDFLDWCSPQFFLEKEKERNAKNKIPKKRTKI